MKIIPLTKGYEAKVDDIDFERVNQYKWYANIKSKYSTPYAYRKQWIPEEKKYISIAMHRFILGITGDVLDVDHRNGKTLDNTRENLRVATTQDNMRNMKIHDGRKYKGVSFCNRPTLKKKWRVYIQVNGKFKQLGYFQTAEEAAKCYDVACKEYFGSFARLNFPEAA
jgi:hypothetical protein